MGLKLVIVGQPVYFKYGIFSFYKKYLTTASSF